ncbi:MAG TPA: NAD(P)H-quinone oxidoreductase [Bryobacteraceae bacterium]|jgi:putative PIG3 family NAD(P)H quinone oxidoreductase|nr:NAD(P)H-quinone oxidoreductase [Bryobacteraceae bacterium]
MIAIEISRFGGPDVLRPVERPKPVVRENEVLVAVKAAGVAHADTLQRQGKYPVPEGASDIPGMDLAGLIEAVGSEVEGWQAGDAVCALTTGGGYAEFCSVPALQVLPIPAGWSFVEAATLPENMFTAYDNVITRGRLQAGETILIHGGTSGVGYLAIMLSQAWRARPIATAGNSLKCKACIGFGASDAINYRELDFVEECKRLTTGRGVDVVLDMVGGAYLERNLDALATEGRLAIIATQKGSVAPMDLTKLMRKRISVFGSMLRSRTVEKKGVIATALLRDVWPLLPAKNVIWPVIDSLFPLEEAHLAHERMESGQHIGKIVLVRA